VYVTGTTASAQAFVAKLDPSGNALWNQPLGASSTNGLAVAVDSAEHVYALYASAAATTDPSKKHAPPPPSTYNFQVASLNAANGSTIWSGSVGSYGMISGYGAGIAVDSAGNVYVAGGGAGVSNGAFFVAKLALRSNGSLTQSWKEQFSGNGWASGVAVDGAGNVYTTGSFTGPVDFNPAGGGPILQGGGNSGCDDVFLSELDTNGAFVAAADMVSSIPSGGLLGWNEYGRAIALDGAGNIYTTGSDRGTANFNPTGTYDLTSNGAQDVFVSQLTQPPSAGGAAAVSSSDAGSQSAALLASSPISPRHFGERIYLLPAARGAAPQETVLLPLLLDGSASALSGQPQQSDQGNAIPSSWPWTAGKPSAAEIRDHVFMDIGTELDSGVLATDRFASRIG
jgi:hypothetical protein